MRQIYTYFKQHDYATIVMGASFRNVDEIIQLAGVDHLTVSPKLLHELQSMNCKIERKLSEEQAKAAELMPKVPCDEASFRWMLNQDQMATEKLSDGIRIFAADLQKLESLLLEKINQ